MDLSAATPECQVVLTSKGERAGNVASVGLINLALSPPPGEPGSGHNYQTTRCMICTDCGFCTG
jgi:hypothetical protein